jgi:oligogalacturonide lyase
VLAASKVPVQQRKKSKPLPAVGEFVRLIDPTTENPVVRLTRPVTTNLLPSPTNRFVSSRERFLVFSSDRTGSFTPFRADLRTGVLEPLGHTAALRPESLCLDAHERALYLIDGSALKELTLSSRRMRTLAEGVTAFSPGISPAEFTVVKEGKLQTVSEGGRVLAEGLGRGICLSRPGGKGCCFTRELAANNREFWYVPFSGPDAAKPVLLAKGDIFNPIWNPDGRSLLFLRNIPKPRVVVSEIHEVVPEGGGERCVSPTSQFAAFAPNEDGSVFVGASRSKAQPTIILLLRSARREMTLCEHRASRPSAVSPVFSPDSRRVYYQSDHQGKWAIYSVNVELLVEPTVPSAG